MTEPASLPGSHDSTYDMLEPQYAQPPLWIAPNRNAPMVSYRVPESLVRSSILVADDSSTYASCAISAPVESMQEIYFTLDEC